MTTANDCRSTRSASAYSSILKTETRSSSETLQFV